MVLSSVITIMLYATTEFYSDGKGGGKLKSHDIEIGGMNDTEFHDIKKIAPPTTEYDNFGTWSANWKLESFPKEDQDDITRLAYPPLKYVAPFLSRIKSWGYKITFYENYQYTFGRNAHGTYPEHVIPSLVHLWILERTSELRMLLPPPPRATTTTTTTTPIPPAIELPGPTIFNSTQNTTSTTSSPTTTPPLISTTKITSAKDAKLGVGRGGSGTSNKSEKQGTSAKSALASDGNLLKYKHSPGIFLFIVLLMRHTF